MQPKIIIAFQEHICAFAQIRAVLIIAGAGDGVALAASEKLCKAAPFVVGPLSDLNLIITDQGISLSSLQPYRVFGIEIIQLEA